MFKTYRNGNVCSENEKKYIRCALAVSTDYLSENMLVARRMNKSLEMRTCLKLNSRILKESGFVFL